MSDKLTPMMAQYHAIKAEHPNEILFFRLGDFYEMFFDDALLVSRELELTLTGRAAGNKERAPMCGVPFHSADIYIQRLIKKGYRVAICEQLEDPKETKGIVERGVIRIITPGTVLLENSVEERQRNYLAYICGRKKEVAVTLAEVSTGECRWGLFDSTVEARLYDLLHTYAPSEIIIDLPEETAETVRARLAQILPEALLVRTNPAEPVRETGYGGIAAADLPENETVRKALAGMFAFLADMLKSEAGHITQLLPLQEDSHMFLDYDCLRHLEITQNLRDGGRRGTLLELVDATMTAMGGRLLSRWLQAPLTDIAAIEERQDAVAAALARDRVKNRLREELGSVFDLERILTRVEMQQATPKDLVALRESLAVLPGLREEMGELAAARWQRLAERTEEHRDIYELLARGIAENAGLQRDGNYIRDGYDAELDELRLLVRDNRRWLADLEAHEKEQAGVKLKIGFNNVFGYYFEVPRSQSEQVPEYFVRKQTLANSERYITPELKEFEVRVLHAQDEIVRLEAKLYREICDKIRPVLPQLQRTARQLAEADVLLSLAETAQKRRYVRPSWNKRRRIEIRDGRHPMLAAAMKNEVFVPNDTVLDYDGCRMMLITGPNMAGKSTYMRQVAVLMLLAQVGSYIPAREASLCAVHRIFTRIGASDDIGGGRSTFMVEMAEVSHILREADENSLVLLDEIGRGTSTYDGMSIAGAVVAYIMEQVGAFALFATHYHELTELAEQYPQLENFTVAVKENRGDIVFLRRIIPGRANRSYGIHVAKLAGIPAPVLARAEKTLAELEAGQRPTGPAAAEPQSGLEDLFTASLWEELASLDVFSLTPLEAMEVLLHLSNAAKERKGL